MVPDHLQVPEDSQLLMVDLLRVHIVGTAQTTTDVLIWLAAHEEHRDVALMDLFLREGTGFRVATHMSRQQVTDALN